MFPDNTTEQLNIAPKYATALFFHNLKPKSYQILANNISIATKLAEGSMLLFYMPFRQ